MNLFPALAARPETFERLRACASLDSNRWLELIRMTPREYSRVLDGESDLPDAAVESVADHFGVEPDDVRAGNLDFRELRVRFSDPSMRMPERYMEAAFGRRRSTITSLDFLERRKGWRARARVLRDFGVGEAELCDPMAPINMLFLSEVLERLAAEGYSRQDFFDMGAYSTAGNRDTILGEVYSRCASPRRVYELMFGEMLKFFEQNCRYTITRLTATGCEVEVLSHPDIAEALGVRHLGNPQVCVIKEGWMAAAMGYIGHEFAEVRESACVHRGEAICRYEIDFTRSAAISSPPPSGRRPGGSST